MSQSRATLIRTAADELAAAEVAEPMRDARLLMRWAAGLDGAGLSAEIEARADTDERMRFTEAVRRRATREPLSHITGKRAFWDREFIVTPDVLDPRPETETLIAEALNRGPFGRVLDLGTGTGCILLTLLAEWPDATGLGTDVSQPALDIAGRNASAFGLSDRAAFRRADWLSGIEGPFDLIVSNPPYVTVDEMASLAPEVRLHEPAGALSPGGDGLDAYRAIARSTSAVLRPGGFLMVEIGPSQSEQVAAVLASGGLNVLMIIPDLDHRARVIVAQA